MPVLTFILRGSRQIQSSQNPKNPNSDILFVRIRIYQMNRFLDSFYLKDVSNVLLPNFGIQN